MKQSPSCVNDAAELKIEPAGEVHLPCTKPTRLEKHSGLLGAEAAQNARRACATLCWRC